MIEIIKKEKRVVSSWSGGKTEQLYIYPQDAIYSKRNFKFRISIATTEQEESNFTKLKDTKRIISILEGNIKLRHLEHYEIELQPYEIDRFSGDWETNSKGKVRDFNLMIKEGEGDFFFKETEIKDTFNFKKENAFNFIFCIEGEIEIEGKILKKEELLITDLEKLEIVMSNKSKIFYGFITK